MVRGDGSYNIALQAATLKAWWRGWSRDDGGRLTQSTRPSELQRALRLLGRSIKDEPRKPPAAKTG